MQSTPKPASRKKFLWWGAALLASVAAVRWLPFGGNKKTSPGPTAKMLTQDGKLVEVDASLLTKRSNFAGPGKKISNAELQNWINKPSINNSENGQQ
jgi:hypothetical protein